MKPPPFDYLPAHSVEEAIGALSRYGDEARLLAGGQSLMPMLNFRLLAPSLLIDISRIDGLGEITAADGALRIGALTRHRRIETSPLVASRLPVMAHAMQHIAHLAIRNVGTIGGSLCHADPAAELPMLAILLNASIEAIGQDGPRTIAAADFFAAPLETTLAPTEMVTGVRILDLVPGHGWGFQEVSRRAGDYALVAACAVLEFDQGCIRLARIALTGAGETPMRACAAEQMLHGQMPDPDLFQAAGAAARDAVSPHGDLHASAPYRQHLVGVLTRRVLAQAAAGARAGPAAIAP